ncbi:MAG: biosynthetic-type acetolactate synthase large subunit, partial [Lentisphaerae bacterium]|nr:biosynthetic-type acetolactate synthase large subunit [Lentisphaerota bacterium]
QVALSAIGNDAFQEADTIGITRAVTKHNTLVRSAGDIPAVIAEAFHIATTGKPGPVLIDIPKDVQHQLAEARAPAAVSLRSYTPRVAPAQESVAALAGAINGAARPLLYVGGGAIAANACEQLGRLARKASIPVTTTLMGLGAFPEDDPLALRMLGMHGTAAANLAVSRCDLLISLGARFDDRVTGKVAEFAPRAAIAHIDIDPSAIGKSVRVDYPVLGDAREAVESLLPLVREATHGAWIAELDALKAKYPLRYPASDTVIQPQFVLEQIDRICAGKAVIVTDVGQHQMWATQFIRYRTPRSFISSGGLGTMGFGLPAAIGAQLARPGALVVAITGDGGIQMNAQELVVAVEHNIPVKVVILNNGHLGMVRQWQQMFYGKRYSAVVLGQARRPANERITAQAPVYRPDFVKLAEAHGMSAVRIGRPADVAPTLERVFADPRPWLVECLVEPEANVLPMVPPGSSVSDMIVD